MFTDEKQDERDTMTRWASLIPESLTADDGQAAHVLIPVDVLADILHLAVSQTLGHGTHHVPHRSVARCMVLLSNSGYVALPQGSDS